MFERILRQFGRIDILVNNAGIHFAMDLFETNEAMWDQTLDTNLKGAYLCSKEVAPIMLGQKSGRIINISSNSGMYHPSAMKFAEYVASKAGMNGLTKALSSSPWSVRDSERYLSWSHNYRNEFLSRHRGKQGPHRRNTFEKAGRAEGCCQRSIISGFGYGKFHHWRINAGDWRSRNASVRGRYSHNFYSDKT